MVGTIYLHYIPYTPGSGIPVMALLLLGNELWSLPFRMLQNCSAQGIDCVGDSGGIFLLKQIVGLKYVLFVHTIIDQSFMKPGYIFHQFEAGSGHVDFFDGTRGQSIHYSAEYDAILECLLVLNRKRLI